MAGDVYNACGGSVDKLANGNYLVAFTGMSADSQGEHDSPGGGEGQAGARFEDDGRSAPPRRERCWRAAGTLKASPSSPPPSLPSRGRALAPRAGAARRRSSSSSC